MSTQKFSIVCLAAAAFSQRLACSHCRWWSMFLCFGRYGTTSSEGHSLYALGRPFVSIDEDGSIALRHNEWGEWGDCWREFDAISMEMGDIGISSLRYTWEDDWLGRYCGDELGSKRRQCNNPRLMLPYLVPYLPRDIHMTLPLFSAGGHCRPLESGQHT